MIRGLLEGRPALANRVATWRGRLDRRTRRELPTRYELAELEAIGPRRGRVLLSMLNQPFHDASLAADRSHTNRWETLRIAEAWRERGFDVDVISWENDRFVPARPYDVVIDARLNLERLDGLLGPDTIRVMHADTSHWLFHQAAQHARLLAMRERRGVALRPRKQVAVNRAAEVADHIVLIGNATTEATYAYAGADVHRIAVSTPVTYEPVADKDWEAARRRFCWFGSEAAVHKGLDLVIEAFAARPHLHLTIAGPVAREAEFVRAYAAELEGLPNIEMVGFLDVAGDDFTRLRSEVGSVVYPSCSEGQNGGVVTCCHAGIVPVVTPETGVDVDGFGFLVEDTTPGGVGAVVDVVAGTEPAELAARAERARAHAMAEHTRDRYAARYDEIVETVLARGRTRA